MLKVYETAEERQKRLADAEKSLEATRKACATPLNRNKGSYQHKVSQDNGGK